jgi:uncharacterized protein (TIGR03437 family)
VLNRTFLLLLLLTSLTVSGESGLSDSTTVWQRSLALFSLRSMKVDNDGNTYFFGEAAPGFVATNPVYGSPGASSAAIIKLDPSGNLVWSTLLYGRIGYYALAVDAARSVYLAGTGDGSTFPTTPGAFQTRLSTLAAFAAKLNQNGQLEWATLLGDQNLQSAGLSIAVDATGVYVAGGAEGHFPTTPGAFQQIAKTSSASDPLPCVGFVAKLNPAGSALIFSTLLAGTGSVNASTTVNRISLDKTGAVYMMGSSSSSDFPVTPGAYQSAGLQFVAKLNATGQALLFSTFVGGDQGVFQDFGVDSTGNSYFTIYSESSAHVRKINSVGTVLVYDRSIEHNTADVVPRYFSFDSSGNVLVSGFTAASDVPIPAPCFRSSDGAAVANSDFVLRLDPTGAIVDGGYLPLTHDRGDFAPIGMDAGGNIYVADTEAGTVLVRKLSPRGVPGSARLRCVAHSATLAKAPVAPGEIVALFGDRIGPDAPASLKLNASGRVADSLANTQVFFDGVAAPLVYTQSRQINVVAPWGIQGRQTTEICVVYLGDSTNCISVPVSQASPGFFRNASGYIAALNEDSTINTPGNGAKIGSIVTLFVTGTGPASPAESDGEVIQEIRPGALAVKANFFRIGGGLQFSFDPIPAEVIFHGPAPGLVSGVEVVQVRVPDRISGGAIQLGTPGSVLLDQAPISLKAP